MRSDLLIQLVESGSKGDQALFSKVVEAVIAEERAKQHYQLADKLQANLGATKNGSSNYYTVFASSKTTSTDYVINSTPSFPLSSLVLAEELDLSLRQFIEEQNRADLLRSYNLEPRNRVLLVGPPGNGKTSIAEAVAYELMMPFYTVKYESLISSYLGETSQKIKSLFDFIKTHKCVVFFDEFDTISKERSDTNETGEIRRVVSNLLLQIDKLPSYVITFAATNHADLLDKAVWRRFQAKLKVDPPTQHGVVSYLERFEIEHKFQFGYSFTVLAKQLLNRSYSEIRDFCLDVLRMYVLSLPSKKDKAKELTKKRLEALKLEFDAKTIKNVR